MLRDYQTDICKRIDGVFGHYRSVMVQMPTGTGKTLVLASLVQRFAAECVLIVAHRVELIEQIKETIQRSGIQSGHIFVESIQTVSRRINDERIAFVPQLVVIDEAHHSLAKTYKLLWEEWPNAKFLGLTATPCRLSGEGFTDLFEVLLESWDVKRFIAKGWLAKYDYYSIKPDSDDQRLIDECRKRAADGDYQVKEIREKLDAAPTLERLFRTFQKYANEKKGIVYAIDIEHAEHIADYYRSHGIPAVAISSRTEKKEREALIRRFKSNHRNLDGTYTESVSIRLDSDDEIQVLVNVDLFSEGFDCPDVEFIQLARPTLSLSKYLQMVGRGLRPHQGKENCAILDNVGLYRRFGLPSDDRDWQETFRGEHIYKGIGKGANLPYLGLIPPCLLEEQDEEVVRITSFSLDNGGTDYEKRSIEKQRMERKTVWMDSVTGIAFDKRPQTINYGGIELLTEDELTYYPRIHSKLIDKLHGFNRKLLETQVGCGISWQKRFISFAQPQRIYELTRIDECGTRIYQDEQGKQYIQQDLDHHLLTLEEAGGIEYFLAQCRKEKEAWEKEVKESHLRKHEYDAYAKKWVFPEGASIEQDGEILHVRIGKEGMEYWLDTKTGFKHYEKPVLFRRGFVSLLREGEKVFVRNLYGMRGIPYRNHEIKADENICTIGNLLTFKDKNRWHLIIRRSEDFRMFLVEDDIYELADGSTKLCNLMIVNNPGKEMERKLQVSEDSPPAY